MGEHPYNFFLKLYPEGMMIHMKAITEIVTSQAYHFFAKVFL